MLTIFIEAYSVNAVVNIKPIYLNKHLFHVSFAVIKKNYNLYGWKNISLK